MKSARQLKRLVKKLTLGRKDVKTVARGPSVLDVLVHIPGVSLEPAVRFAYDRRTLMDKAAYKDFVIEIIRRIEVQKGFEVLPRRWVVERTFG